MSVTLIAHFRNPHPDIIQYPDNRLRKRSAEVRKFDNSVEEIAGKLLSILKELDKPYKPWLGMAAPQLGYNKRIVAVKKRFLEYQVLVNPEVVEQKWLLPTITACYSLKGLYLGKSHYWFSIKYLDLDSKSHQEVFTGGQAVLMQQEIDHLEGKLVCD